MLIANIFSSTMPTTNMHRLRWRSTTCVLYVDTRQHASYTLTLANMSHLRWHSTTCVVYDANRHPTSSMMPIASIHHQLLISVLSDANRETHVVHDASFQHKTLTKTISNIQCQSPTYILYDAKYHLTSSKMVLGNLRTLWCQAPTYKLYTANRQCRFCTAPFANLRSLLC